MKTTQHRDRFGFTLIELMAVITIVVILAGLVAGGLGFVGARQDRDKAKVQIALIETALEEYKLDNGSYPPGIADDGSGTSHELFKALYLDGAEDLTGDTKIYIPQLDPENNNMGWTFGRASQTSQIRDPWDNEYRYRTGTSNTQNPDFDLWTVGKDGKTRANESAEAKENRDDIRNF